MTWKIHLAPHFDPRDNPKASDRSDEDQGGVAVAEAKPRLKTPPKYAVILLNDHYSTMEFVVEVLQKYFQKTGDEAVQIMLAVHRQGKGVAGVYSFEIAETKAHQVHEHARAQGFPLRCVVEEMI